MLSSISSNIMRPIMSRLHDTTGAGASLESRVIQALFSNDEQGALYDPSDLSTLFQDSVGTTPVTGAGQAVGLILDKRLRLTREEVSISGESADTWDVLGDGLYRRTAVGTWSAMRPAPDAARGGFMEITVEVVSIDAPGSLQIFRRHASLASNEVVASVASGDVQVGTVLHVVAAPHPSNVSNPSYNRLWYDSSDFKGVLRFSFKRLPGNHAYQSTALSRPLLQQENDLFYLDFDGTNDMLMTNVIDLSATSKLTAFTGVRKESNTDSKVIAELGNGSQTGCFSVFGPISANNGYGFRTRSDTEYTESPAGFPPNDLAVLTMQCDTLTTGVSARRNGTSIASGAGAASATLFSARQMYIGARSSLTMYFDGRIYQLIVRGTESTPEQLALSEQYVASKTGVTLA